MSGFAPATKKVDIKQLTDARAEAAELRALLAELAPEEPINQDEQGGCVWCGWSENMWFYEQRGCRADHKRGSMYSDKRPETHTPDCPWITARRILEQTKEP